MAGPVFTLIAPGGQPTTLQGLWNDKMNPPWGSKYTSNINVEMNYWPMEVTNLSECHEPLFAVMEELTEELRLVERAAGNARKLGHAANRQQ